MAEPRLSYLARRDALRQQLERANDVDAIVAELTEEYRRAREWHIGGKPDDLWDLVCMALNERRRRARRAA